MEFQRLERELCLVLRIFKFHETWNSTREPKLELARIRLLKILKSLSKIAWKIIGQLIANIRETMQCERTSKRFLSFSIVQKFSALVKKKLHRFYYITLLFPLYTRRDFCHRNAFYARPSLMPMYQRFHSFVHSSLKSSSHRSIRGIRPFILNIV